MDGEEASQQDDEGIMMYKSLLTSRILCVGLRIHWHGKYQGSDFVMSGFMLRH